ncbi:hypothetical protein RCL1_007574 [Eukaryota sp. TZLM3-RCL]
MVTSCLVFNLVGLIPSLPKLWSSHISSPLMAPSFAEVRNTHSFRELSTSIYNLTGIKELSLFSTSAFLLVKVSSVTGPAFFRDSPRQYFSFLVVDEYGDDIRVVGFGDEIVSKLKLLVRRDKFFLLGRFKTKLSHRSQTGFELEVGINSLEEIPTALTFLTLGEIAQVDNNSLVNFIAVMLEVRNVRDVFCQRLGRTQRVMEFLVADDSYDGAIMTVKVWNEVISSIASFPSNSVIQVQGAKTLSYYGKFTLSFDFSTSVTLDTSYYGRHLLSWFPDAQPRYFLDLSEHSSVEAGKSATIESLTNSVSTSVNYVWVLGFISNITPRIGSEFLWYKSCKSCRKKVLHGPCSRCNEAESSLRYLVKLQITDTTDTITATCFEEMNTILGVSAFELSQMDVTKELFNVQFKPFKFKLRITSDSEIPIVVKVQAVDFAAEARSLLQGILGSSALVPSTLNTFSCDVNVSE